MTKEPKMRKLHLTEDLHLAKGRYLIYDFYRDRFLGEFEDMVSLDFEPYECRILSLRRRKDVPQILSTSRHITQGAAELEKVEFCSRFMKIKAFLPAKDRYTVKIHVPESYQAVKADGFETFSEKDGILTLSFLPPATGHYAFSIEFIQSKTGEKEI